MKCPCYKCKERHNLCHDDCKRHKQWIEEKHKAEEWLKVQRYNSHIDNIANRQKNRYTYR